MMSCDGLQAEEDDLDVAHLTATSGLSGSWRRTSGGGLYRSHLTS